MDLEQFFNPRSIAVVGASEEEGKVGNVIAKNILTLGYQGGVFLVNPKHDTLFGKKCYKSLDTIEGAVDLAIISIPAKFVASEIEKNADKIKNYVVISAGFSETGEEGKRREEDLFRIARDKNLNILGPNCLGFIIPGLKLNASFAGGMPDQGNISFISQSGALAVAMMDVAKKENIKFSSVVSIGNKMNISESELLDYFSRDKETKVIGMYLEGIKNGPAFMAAAKKTTVEKPVVIIKAGKTERAQRAISSHTGALAGSEQITNAVFSKSGITKADDLEEFFDLVDLISNTNPPITKKVVVITNAGGPGVLTTDAFSGKIIELAEIEEEIKEKLKLLLPPESSVENPIDLLGDAKEDRYSQALKLIQKDKNIGAVICVLTPQDQTPVMKIARKIINFKKKSELPVVTVFIGGDRIKNAVKKMEENGIPNYGFPDRAVKALDDYYKWKIAKEKNIAGMEIGTGANEERKKSATLIIQKARTENRKALYYSEAREVMKLYGVETAPSRDILPEDSELSFSDLGVIFPVVLKIDSDKMLHKTDKEGVVLGIKNEDELSLAISKMKTNFPGERLIVQNMLPKKTELILGIKKDAVFGPVIVYGLGGIYTEVLKMVDFLILPLTIEDIEKSLTQSKISFLFKETRGQKPYDISELAKVIKGISEMAEEIDEISEFDINPLLIYNDGMAAVAVDVKIII